MRKLFTRFFSLMLLLMICCFPNVGFAAADCDLTIAGTDVELVTDVTTICNGEFLDYKVVGYDPALYEFAFNYNPLNPSGTFEALPQFTTAESSTFTVNVREKATGCISNTITITAPDVAPLVTTAAGIQNALCNGDQGEITLNWTGGIGALEYYVVPSANFNLPIANLAAYKKSTWQVGVPAGTYYVAVQNVNGCANLAVAGTWKSVTITQPAAIVIPAPFVAVVNNTCFGGTDGKYNVHNGITGGVAPFEASIDGVNWVTMNSPVADPSGYYEFTNLAAGDYTVTVRDANGCTATRAFAITEPEQITFDIAIVDVDCFDGDNGQITVSNVKGGAGNYSYSLDGIDFSNTTGVFPGLAPTYYSLWVKDGNNCVVAYENPNNSQNVIAVQSPAGITFADGITATDPSCMGEMGNISIEAKVGGVVSSAVKYSFDNGATWVTTSSKAVAPGTYQVWVSNAAGGCPVGPVAVTIADKTAVTATVSNEKAPTCPGGSDGRFVITATGGTGEGYTYSVDGSNFYANNIIFETEGDHTVVVKDSNGCLSEEYTVTIPTLSINEIVLTSQENITCFGANSGRIVVDVTSWAADRTPKIWWATTEAGVYTNNAVLTDETEFTAGTYYVGASDAYGCFIDEVLTVTITEVPKLEITAALVTEQATCFGDPDGIITITANGGTPFDGGVHAQYWMSTSNIDVSLTDEDDFSDFESYDSETGVSTTTVQALKGTYYVYVRDNGCTITKWAAPIVVEGYSAVAIVDPLPAAITHNDCFGGVMGAIVVAPATGGSESFSYTLQKWDMTEEVWVNVTDMVEVETSTFTGLVAGTYKVIATDLEGCSGDETANIVVTEPVAPVSFTLKGTDITCNGANNGIAQIVAMGGTGAYEFKIGTNAWQVMPAAVEGVSTKNVVITAAGDYSIMVRDAKGCEAAAQEVTIDEPTVIVATLTSTNVTTACTVDGDGTITVEVEGGIEAGEYEVSIDGSTWVSTTGGEYTFDELEAGSYTISAKDDNGCVMTAQAVITQPAGIAAAAAVTANVTCKGSNEGVIAVTGITGGTSPYTVIITGATAKVAVDGAASFAGLVAGTYTAIVTDSEGCSWTINNLIVTEPTALVLLATKLNDIGCTVPGKFSLAVTGGTGAYTYYWAKSDLVTGHVLLADMPAAGTVWSESNVASVTEAGTYIVWAKDANNCMVGGEGAGTPVNQWRVKIEKPVTVITIDALVADAPLCNGEESASITVTATITKNGVAVVDPSYTVSIDGVEVEGGVLTDLGAGTYTVVVTDANGCSATEEVEITEPEALTATLAKAAGSFTCPDAVQGYIEVSVDGGTADYKYELWRDGSIFVNYQVDNSFLVQIGHFYEVKVMDANDCVTTTNVVTIDPVQPIVATLSETTCYSDEFASVIISATGEEGRTFFVRYHLNTTEVYPTTWTAFDSNNEISIENLVFANGTPDQNFYYFEVKDSEGCVFPEFVKSFVPTQHPLQVTAVQADDQLSASITITGGISPYSYQVGNGPLVDLPLAGNTFQVVELKAPSTVVTVYDAHGCFVAEPLEVAPLAVSAVPASGNNTSNAFDVVLTFNRPVTVAAGDITGGTFTAGTGTEFTVAMAGDDLEALTLALGTGIVDAAGNTFAGETFTYKVGDHVAPTVVVTAPAAPVATVFTVGLKFSEPVSGVAGAITVTGGTLTDVEGMGTDYVVTVSGVENTVVTVAITDAIVDMSSNANKFAGQTLTYTIGDFTAPSLVTMFPTVEDVLTNNHPLFKMTFSENVEVGEGGNLVVYKLNTTVPVLTIAITSAMIEGKDVNVTYTTLEGLDKDTRYYVLVDNSAIVDLAGNKYIGIGDVATWTFKTGSTFATGIDADSKNSKFEVFPNPFDKGVNLRSSSKLSKVVVTNIAGQTVKEVVNPSDYIQLNELRSGIYFISLYNMDNVIAKTTKIVKR